MSDQYLKYVITEDIFVIPEEYATCNEPSLENKVSEPPMEYAKPTLTFTGNRKSEVLVIINNDAHTGLITDRDRLFLTNILKAVGIDVNDICLINLSSPELFDQVLKESGATKVLSFNSNKPDLYYKSTIHQNITIIHSHALKEISEDKLLKKSLWEVLQQVFEV